jgi:hypothetical protein
MCCLPCSRKNNRSILSTNGRLPKRSRKLSFAERHTLPKNADIIDAGQILSRPVSSLHARSLLPNCAGVRRNLHA